MTPQIIRGAWLNPKDALPRVPLNVERLRLAKRIWRGAAEDGMEFGFELETPLRHGEIFFETTDRAYAIAQLAESVLEVALDLAPSAAAAIGWAIGNLHLECSTEPNRLLTPDDPAARQLLSRIGISYQVTSAIFRAGKFSRGLTETQELGPSHRH